MANTFIQYRISIHVDETTARVSRGLHNVRAKVNTKIT